MVWVDKSGVICIKTVDPYNDPVELSENEAEELSDWLRKEIKKMRR